MDTTIIADVVKKFGTPLYLYWEQVITEQYKKLAAALKSCNGSICYAVKANSNSHILSLLHELGAGFDIVSGGELARVLRIGCDPQKIVFAGVGKSESEIRSALLAGIRLLNVESEQELDVIEDVAGALGKRAPIAFRVNPNVAIDAHPYVATGLRSSKFGIALEDIPRIWQRVRSSPWLELVGLDCHIGSQICEIEPLEQAYRSVLGCAESPRVAGAPVRILDFGGGQGVSFSGQYEPLDLAAYERMLNALPGLSQFELIVEPGKFLVAEAGVLVTKVVYCKENHGNRFVVTDAGMNDLIRPSLYEAHHHIEVLGKDSTVETQLVDVVGPVCETGCFLGRARNLPIVERGDIALVRDTGAYGFTMASNYNSRPFPAEVLIDRAGKARLIRKRQEISDLWRDEE